MRRFAEAKRGASACADKGSAPYEKRRPAGIGGPSVNQTSELMPVVLAVVIVVTVTIAVMIPVAVTIALSFADFAFVEFAVPLPLAFAGAKLPFAFGSPGVIAVNAAVLSLPVTFKESFSVVTRPDPASPDIGRPTPVAFMPLIVVSDRVPVTLDPEELGPGARRPKVNHSRCRWGTNSDSDGHLCECRQGQE